MFIKTNYCIGKTYFEGQSKVGILPRFNADRENARALRAKRLAAGQPPPSYTFTDLAQMVCKVSRGDRYVDPEIDSDSDEMEYEGDLEEDAQEVGYASEPTAGFLDRVMTSINFFDIWDIPKSEDSRNLTKFCL